jgi:hypothetical protein
MNERNNIHGLLSDNELDRMLETWKVPKASPDLAQRIASRAATVEQTEQRSMVTPLLRSAAALLLAAGLGIFVGLMEGDPDTVDISDYVFGQHVEEGLSL